MARYEFGSGLEDYVVQPADGLWQVAAGAEVTLWDAASDGTQYTDLLDADSAPTTSVVADEFGRIPRFYGPDEVTGLWADAGGDRGWMDAHVPPGQGGGYTSISRIVASATAPADIRAAATYVCDGVADQVEIQAALDDARDNGGGEIQLTVGDFNLTAPLSIEGTDDVDIEIGIDLRGQGARATQLIAGPGLTSAIHLTKVVRVHLRDLGMTISGATDGITSATTNGPSSGHRSFWNSSFKNLQVNGPWDGSHTGWALNLGSPFRSVFENIEIGGVGNGVRMYSEHTDFNPGDCTVERVFVDSVGDNTTAYRIESTTAAGVMNQIAFEMVEAIAAGTGCTGIHITGVGGWGTAHTHWRGVNLEEFDTLLDVEYGSSNTFRFNHIHLRSAPGLTAFDFGANSFDNAVLSTGLLYVTDACQLYADGNTMDASIPNRIEDTRIYTAAAVAVTGSANPAGTTVRRGITAAGTGTVSVANTPAGSAFAPVDHGLIAWTDSPSAISGTGWTLAAGQVYLSKVKISGRATVVSNIWFYVGTAGTSLTAGQNFVGLYDATGTLIVSSADATSHFTSSGAKTVPIAPQMLEVGSYYVAFLANGGGTQPSVSGGGGNTGVGNIGLATSQARFLNTSGGNTALPASIALGSQSQNFASRWAALS